MCLVLLYMFLVERVEFDSSFDSTTPGRYEKAYITPVSRGMLRVEAISAKAAIIGPLTV